MPMWRCPHCGTPQAETARCWVCRRSSTTCSTCRHFRSSIAAQLGYCGLDRRRLPLSGNELRGCWEPGPIRVLDGPGATAYGRVPIEEDDPEPPSPALRLRDFVPVELARHRAARARRAPPPSGSRDPVALDPATDLVRPSTPPDLHPGPIATDQATLFADADL